MAIIKLGVLVVGVRGTIGGALYSANKAGPYVRAWSKGANPRTVRQQEQRAHYSAMPGLWAALTDTQRDDWDDWAALPAQELFNSLGEAYSPSGFQWFQIINLRLLNADRSTRTTEPTDLQPAAPTFSSLVLPFLPQQATKITYPSGEFDPDFDLVLKVKVLISIGRMAAPASLDWMRTVQNPPDTDTEFVAEYLERINLAGATIKGFAELFRQTDQGMRSAAAVQTFISSDAPAYSASALAYDGVNDWGARGADLTSNADTKVGLWSFWFRLDGSDGSTLRMFQSTGTTYSIRRRTDNLISIILENTAGGVILEARTVTTFTSGAAWHNVIWAYDLAAATVQLAVDGVAEAPSIITGPTDALINYTAADHGFGASQAGASPWDGCLSEAYANFAATLDLSIPANIARFVDVDGFPVDLGADGAFPTGSQPIIYFDDADPSANLGYGGNYVNNAALGACSDDPP